MAKNVQMSDVSGLTKSAILLIALGPEKSAKIFKHLKEDEIEQLTLEIANTRSVSPQTKEDVMAEFYQVCIAQQYIAEGGITYAKELLEKADDEIFNIFLHLCKLPSNLPHRCKAVMEVFQFFSKYCIFS